MHVKKDMLYYGLIAALVMLLVKGADYNLFSKHISVEIYSSILVIIFTALGLWFGLKLTTPKVVIEPRSVDHFDLSRLQDHGISQRELEVIQLLSEGHSNQQIADQLYISLSTVKSHLQKVYQKLGVKTRTQAIQKAKTLSIPEQA